MSIFHSVKRLFKHSAVYGIGHILTRSMNFLLLPFHTNLFPREEFGVASLLFTYLAIMNIFFTYGLDVAFFRYFMLVETCKEKKTVFTTAFTTLLTTSLLFAGSVFVFAEPFSRLVFSAEIQALDLNLVLMIRLASGILFFDALYFLPFLILRAQEKSTLFITFKTLFVVLNLVGNAFFILVLKQNIEGIFWANLIASIVTAVGMFLFSYKNLSFNFSFPMLKSLMAFGLPYIPTTLSVVLMDTIDRVFIEKFDSVEAVGLYSAGAKLGMFMALVVAAFRFAWHPFFLSTAKQENAKEIFSKVFTYVVMTCLTAFVMLSIFIKDIAQIRIGSYTLIGKEFMDSTIVVPVIMLAYVFYAIYVNFIIGIYLEKKTHYLPFIAVSGMIGNVIVLYTTIPYIGMMGAAWARVIAYVIMATALYFVSRKLYYIKYEWLRLIKLSVVVAVVFFVGMMDAVQASFLLKFVSIVAFPVLLLVTGFFEKAELLKVRQIILRK